MGRYMEMYFIDSTDNARLTGVGAEYENDDATTKAFESARPHDIGFERGAFILDLHEDDGEIVDSIAVSAESFTAITGERVLSESEYIAYDEKCWCETAAASRHNSRHQRTG